ncbi:hypothetical protein GCM10010458_36610 [Microbacterium luteolum]|uniref:Uncharacterized protein n=1 Tax=Microbacterium luteolum TaxID=69367 RepID=A0ABY7XK82_MICLT|nr:hypothetical protein [Microbacterium luteolum]WDM42526.1 hypothetical protein KV395_04235 [Microbacterium luteolum]
MAKFIINKGAASQRSVEAEKYSLANGFFWFYDAESEIVLTYKADNTISVTRESASDAK